MSNAETKEYFGKLITLYYITSDPLSVIRQTDTMLTFTRGLLYAEGKLDKVPPSSKRTYREILDNLGATWESAIDDYDAIRNDWKPTLKKCRKVNEEVMMIILKEELVSLDVKLFDTAKEWAGAGGEEDGSV
jgi:hypothetical protein